jgi:hypothetical protein
LKDEFDNAYEMLADKLYKVGAYSYKDIRGSGGEAEDIRAELLELKGLVDGKMRYLVRSIYKKLKIKYDR